MREEKEEEENRNDQLKKGYHFLLCLRPAVMENLGTPGSNGSPFKHLRMESLDGSHRILPAPDNSPAAAAGHLKKKSRRKFVRLIKAVLFETSLANKIRKKAKKKKQSSIGDSPSLKMEKKYDTYPVMATTLNKKFGKKNTAKIISATPSIETSSILSSSSCASSVASSSMRFTESDLIEQKEKKKKKNEQEKGKGYYGINNNGLFFYTGGIASFGDLGEVIRYFMHFGLVIFRGQLE